MNCFPRYLCLLLIESTWKTQISTNPLSYAEVIVEKLGSDKTLFFKKILRETEESLVYVFVGAYIYVMHICLLF